MAKNDLDPHKKIDELIEKTDKEKQKESQPPTTNVMIKGMKEIKENVQFVNKTQDEPIITKKYDRKQLKKVEKKKFYVTLINFNHYIQQQAWPSSIYFIDKLLRLNTSASLDWQKRYLAKKRPINKEYIYLMIIIVIIIIAILVLWLFLSGGA